MSAVGPYTAISKGNHAIVRKLVAVVLLFGLGFGGLAAYSQLKFKKVSEALDAEIATYKRQSWQRPTLRRDTIEGNAATLALAALHGFKGLSAEERDGLAAQLYYGQPLSAAQVALLEPNAMMIGQLRAATQAGFAMTTIAIEQGPRAALPPYPLVMDAALLLLAQGAHAGADECLMTGTDAMRLGQDLVPGAPLEAASVAMRINSVASAVLTHCGFEASPDALPRAARELNTLATHPPPTGTGIELADILAQVELRRLAELWPKDSSESTLTRLRRRPLLFEAFARFDNPTRWREITPDKYPQALETWLREHDWRAHSELRLVADATEHVQGWLYDDMRGQALVRALTVGFATISERMRQRRTPREPVSLNESAMRDPFNGQPLKWRIAQDGRELTLWSVGEDRRDDKGSSEWDAQAPLDVVVHFKLKPFDEAELARRAHR